MTTQWIDLEECAKRTGKTAGHLKRLASGDWQSRGLAKKERPEKGGKARWVVNVTADAALSPVKMPEQMPSDLRSVSATKRDAALKKLDVLKRWEKHCQHAFALQFDRDKATGHFLELELINHNLRISRATLYNWQTAYRQGGVMGLIDARGGKPSEKPADPFLEEVKRLYLDRRHPMLSKCYDLAKHAAREQGWSICSLKTAQRYIGKIPAGVVYKHRGGEDVYVAKAEPFIQRDYTTLTSNEMWCGDHHQFDVLVKVRERIDGSTGELRVKHVRPWITAWQDMRSRKIVGYAVFAHDPNSDTVLSTLRAGILAHGVPRKLYIDNGRDYDCADLNGRTKKDRWAKRKVRVDVAGDGRTRGIFAALKIEAMHTWAYHGQSKPIERWFGTMEGETWVWDTYCGNSPAAKPHDLQEQLERGRAPELGDFVAWVDAWVQKFNATHAHQGQGMDGLPPDVVFQRSMPGEIRTASRELLDVLLLRKIGPLKVGRNGVRHQGLYYGQYQLSRHLDQEVYLRVDDRDLSSVQVYLPDDTFVCLAESNVFVPVNADSQTLRAAIAEKRGDRRATSEYHNTRRPRAAQDLPGRIVRIHAEQQAAADAALGNDPNQPPPVMQPIRSPLEAALPALQRALDARVDRVAVGAEDMSFSTLQQATRNYTHDVADHVDAAPVNPMALLRNAMRLTDTDE